MVKRALPLILLIAIGGTYFIYTHFLRKRAFEWAGTVEARTVTVGSRTGGRIAQILVAEGAEVAPNQPLILIEPGDLQAQRAIAVAQVAQAQAQVDKATLDADRSHRLLATQAIAQAEADASDTALKTEKDER